MKILHLIPALPDTVAVYADDQPEGWVETVIGWATIETPSGLQYVAPMSCDLSTARVRDARDEANFVRVTDSGDLSIPEAARTWDAARLKIDPPKRCRCRSWDLEMCAAIDGAWQSADVACECSCHSHGPDRFSFARPTAE